MGVRPRSPDDEASAPSAEDDAALTCDRLTRDFSLFQRRRGHRFSSDDVVTAWAALQRVPRPRRVLDLGCGIGSVLLHVAWCAPEAGLVGVEAQAVSFALLQRNIAHNGLAERVTVHHGDLRDAAVQERVGAGFDLVTGTPPYFPPGSAVDARDPQRAYARVEHRGGVEDYLAAARRALAPDGTVVLCGDADAEGRVEAATRAEGLARVARWVVFPRAGARPLFSVWAMRCGEGEAVREESLTLRDAAGRPSDDARRLRAFGGFG